MIILHQGRCGKFVWLHSASSMSGTLGCEWIAVWWHIHRSWHRIVWHRIRISWSLHWKVRWKWWESGVQSVQWVHRKTRMIEMSVTSLRIVAGGQVGGHRIWNSFTRISCLWWKRLTVFALGEIQYIWGLIDCCRFEFLINGTCKHEHIGMFQAWTYHKRRPHRQLLHRESFVSRWWARIDETSFPTMITVVSTTYLRKRMGVRPHRSFKLRRVINNLLLFNVFQVFRALCICLYYNCKSKLVVLLLSRSHLLLRLSDRNLYPDQQVQWPMVSSIHPFLGSLPSRAKGTSSHAEWDHSTLLHFLVSLEPPF